ncbi:MAG: hypothetical protein AAB294_05640 [Pseudomonadota bacterium]
MRKALKDGSPNQAINYREFVVKSAIFSAIFSIMLAIGLATGLVFGLPDAYSLKESLVPVKEQIKKELQKDRTRVRLLGLFTTNPYAHYRMSYIEEEAGNIRNAIEEIEFAIGLLELHSPDKSVKERYQNRLGELKRKLAKPPAAK